MRRLTDGAISVEAKFTNAIIKREIGNLFAHGISVTFGHVKIAQINKVGI